MVSGVQRAVAATQGAPEIHHHRADGGGYGVNAAEFVSLLADARPRQTASGLQCRCPAHDDGKASLCVTQAADRVLIHCQAGCTPQAVCDAAGVKLADLFTEPKQRTAKPQIVAQYDYRDESGNVLLQVVRFEPKDFRQRRPDGNGGWEWKTADVRRVLYRLPEIIRDVKRGLPIVICEGEKDVESLVRLGFSATCNSGGVGKWRDEYSETLRGVPVYIIADKDEPGRKHAQTVAASLQAASVRVLELPDFNGRKVKDAADYIAAGATSADIQTQFDAAPEWKPQAAELPATVTADSQTNDERIRAMLESRRFNFAVVPPQVEPVFTINGIGICTPGNLTGITAQIKSGKSSWIAAMLAATMTTDSRADCFGIAASNPDGKAVIHIDTEQAIQDWDSLVRQAAKRARIAAAPPWLLSYCLTGWNLPDARAALPIILGDAKAAFGAVHSVFIDGVADLVPSVNDEEESLAFVSTLHGQAIEYHCPIIGAIHFNPNSEKTRGHLGSQLERKAETNLRLDKEDETVTVYSLKARKSPITKDAGPRFAWSEADGMHVSVTCQRDSRRDANLAELRIEAEAMFTAANRNTVAYGEALTLLATACRVSPSTAKRRFTAMIQAGLVTKDLVGRYTLNLGSKRVNP